MKVILSFLPAAIFAISMTASTSSALACNDRGNCANAPGHNKEVRGAPGPIAGAGLPILAVGYGVYWLVRRRRTAS